MFANVALSIQVLRSAHAKAVIGATLASRVDAVNWNACVYKQHKLSDTGCVVIQNELQDK